MQDVFKCISDIGIVPVVKLTNPQRDAVPLARALIAGGIPIMEIIVQRCSLGLAQS